MKDLQAALRKLQLEASECELIANLATDLTKQETFERLADQYRAMIEQLQSDIAKQQ